MAFGKYFTDHMLKIAYHKRLGGWQKPEITPMETLNLHPAAKVFHYAVEVSRRDWAASMRPIQISWDANWCDRLACQLRQ